jgi:molybdopterin converting factor small subunit
MGSITVSVKLFGTLRQYVPAYDHNKGVNMTLDEGSTIQDLLGILGLPENEARIFFVKGISRKHTYTLNDSDEISIFLQMSGG